MQTFFDNESEKILLCQMILNNKIIPEVNSALKATTFYNPLSAKCFSQITEFFAKGMKVDELLLMTEFKEISAQYKGEVLNATTTASNWKFYADKIRNTFIARNCNQIMLAKSAEIRPENASQKIQETLSELNAVLNNNVQPHILTYTDMIPAYLDKLNERINNRTVPFGIPTGLETLDELFGGGFPDEYAFISARPSIGKTALALQLANKFSLKRKVLFIEFEMTETSIMERTIMNESKLDGRKLRSGFMTESEYGSLNNCFGRLYDNKNMVFAFPTDRNIDTIISMIRGQVISQQIGAVFIDQMSFLYIDGFRAKWEMLAEISKRLQNLQKELKIPFVVLVQQNREAEGKDGGLGTIANADAMAQDADIVMILERERQKDASEFLVPTKLKVEKNRNFACGTVYLNFFPRYAMFEVDPNPPLGEEIEKTKKTESKKDAF